MNKFKIIVPFYNVEQWISTTVDSILSQTYKNYDCYFSDDLSTDGSSELFNDLKQSNLYYHRNIEKLYALGNIYNTIQRANCSDNDIIVILDGDDWLAHDRVLEILNNYYTNDILLTYGSYVEYPSGNRPWNVSEFPDVIVNNNIYRKDIWRSSHLRTFKYKLWKNIKIEDLKDSSGNFYRMTGDLAAMFPMLEMSGGRFKYIPDVLYCYNLINSNNDHKIDHGLQVSIEHEIRNKKPYEVLFR